MEDRIKDRFSDDVLREALKRYSLQGEKITKLGGFESYIYAIDRVGNQGILRIAHNIRRSPNQIRGELDWIDYLSGGGVGVARPWRSDSGDWVEPIEDGEGGYFLASVFEKARGDIHRGPDWPGALLWEYGNQIGKMHNLTKVYQPKNPAWKRPDWDDPVHHEVGQFIPSQDYLIRDLYHKQIELIKTLPVNNDVYGLIHQDAHQGNFFVDDQGKITFFDFDDSSYSWFVEDIALILFYAVMGSDDPQDFTRMFLKGFLPGYFAAIKLDLAWFQNIPLFMKMRELDLYAVIHRSFDIENLDDPWCIWYLDGRKERLEQEVPYLDLNFSKLDFSQFLT
jgi:Ser/Thr protein kinase RdoA (MazF antagonist)